MCCAIPLYRTHVKKRPMVISQKCRTMVSNKPLDDVVLLLDGITCSGSAEVFFHNVKTLGIGQMFRHDYCFF